MDPISVKMCGKERFVLEKMERILPDKLAIDESFYNFPFFSVYIYSMSFSF